MAYYTVTEVAEIFGFTRQTILHWINKGKIKATKPFREYRIPAEEVERLKGVNDGKSI